MRWIVLLLLLYIILTFAKRDTEIRFSEPECGNTGEFIELLEAKGIKFPHVAAAQWKLQIKEIGGFTDSEIQRWINVYNNYSDAMDEYAAWQKQFLATHPDIQTEEQFISALIGQTDSLYWRGVNVRAKQLKKQQLTGE